MLAFAVSAFQVMRTHDNKLERGLAFGCLMALVHMGLHCTVDFNLQAPANALLFLTILMMSWWWAAQPAKAQSRRHAAH